MDYSIFQTISMVHLPFELKLIALPGLLGFGLIGLVAALETDKLNVYMYEFHKKGIHVSIADLSSNYSLAEGEIRKFMSHLNEEDKALCKKIVDDNYGYLNIKDAIYFLHAEVSVFNLLKPNRPRLRSYFEHQ